MKKAIILSFLLHGLLFTCFIFCVENVFYAKTIGKNRFIPIYLYHQPVIFKEAQKRSSTEIAKRRVVEKQYTGLNPSFSKMKHFPNILSAASSQQVNTYPAGEHSVLLMRLHDLVQGYIDDQHYATLQSGTTTVVFFLFPDGHMEDVHIFQSSGQTILDRLALQAVRAVCPVGIAKDFLKEKKRLGIQIIFEGATTNRDDKKGRFV